jgi:hypothetical protein
MRQEFSFLTHDLKSRDTITQKVKLSCIGVVLKPEYCEGAVVLYLGKRGITTSELVNRTCRRNCLLISVVVK